MCRSTDKFATSKILYLLTFVMAFCPAIGQAQEKKKLTPADYHLWSSLELSDISTKGEWVSYNVHYQYSSGNLFVKSTDGQKEYSYPFGSRGKFCGERWFAAQLETGKLTLTNLQKGSHERIEDVADSEFSLNCDYLFTFSKPQDGRRKISIRELSSGISSTVEHVTSWRFNNDRTKLAYLLDKGQDGHATVVDATKSAVPIARFQLPGSLGTNIVWQDNSASLVVVFQPNNTSKEFGVLNTGLAMYRFEEEQLLLLQPGGSKGFSTNKHVQSTGKGDLKISDDGKRVFFSEVPNRPIESFNSPVVEVWHGDDKLLYSEQKQYGNFEDWAKTAVWYPDTDEVFPFMPNETHVILSGDQKYALASSMEPCELQFKYSPDRDYYLTDLSSKERKLWMRCHSPELHHTLMAPSGTHIVYFKDGHWFSYAIATNQHKNLTQPLSVHFYDEANDTGDKPDAYGFGGWTEDGRAIVIYDQYDLWKVDLDGIGSEKLTKGRDQNIAYRIAKTKAAEEPFNGIYPGAVIDLKEPMVLAASSPDNSMQGYYLWENGIENPLEFGAHRIYGLRKAKGADAYAFLQENYETPTSLRINNRTDTRTLFTSNPQHDEYRWGKVMAISYIGSTGAPLKGLLYYPADYKKGMAYPMIVHVYQKQSRRMHSYENPSERIADGFSIVNFVTNGYFVLLPDIDYVMNSPSDSAVVSTEAAVNNVLSRGDVDPKRVGLIGHSFGGYETSYIVTKSNIFAAAVAGAALTDLVSEYLTVSENYKKAEIWRYEYFTNRMTKPLFDNFEGYLQNSAVYNAPTIQTPLLLWTGEKDRHIASTQSTELYLAMRRLGKKVTMLRYPKQDHSLDSPDAQSDLVAKVMEWFDYYLKDGPKAGWMKNPHGKLSN